MGERACKKEGSFLTPNPYTHRRAKREGTGEEKKADGVYGDDGDQTPTTKKKKNGNRARTSSSESLHQDLSFSSEMYPFIVRKTPDIKSPRSACGLSRSMVQNALTMAKIKENVVASQRLLSKKSDKLLQKEHQQARLDFTRTNQVNKRLAMMPSPKGPPPRSPSKRGLLSDMEKDDDDDDVDVFESGGELYEEKVRK